MITKLTFPVENYINKLLYYIVKKIYKDLVLTDMCAMRGNGIDSSTEVQVDWQPEHVITEMIGNRELVQG